MADTTPRGVGLEESRRLHKKPRKGQYEGSPADIRQDAAGARRAGSTVGKYEGSAADRRQDRAGQRRMTKRGK